MVPLCLVGVHTEPYLFHTVIIIKGLVHPRYCPFGKFA